MNQYHFHLKCGGHSESYYYVAQNRQTALDACEQMLKKDCAKKGVIPLGFAIDYEDLQIIQANYCHKMEYFQQVDAITSHVIMNYMVFIKKITKELI